MTEASFNMCIREGCLSDVFRPSFELMVFQGPPTPGHDHTIAEEAEYSTMAWCRTLHKTRGDTVELYAQWFDWKYPSSHQSVHLCVKCDSGLNDQYNPSEWPFSPVQINSTHYYVTQPYPFDHDRNIKPAFPAHWAIFVGWCHSSAMHNAWWYLQMFFSVSTELCNEWISLIVSLCKYTPTSLSPLSNTQSDKKTDLDGSYQQKVPRYLPPK